MFITYILSQFIIVLTGAYKSILQRYLVTYSYIKITIYAFICTNTHIAQGYASATTTVVLQTVHKKNRNNGREQVTRGKQHLEQ